LSASAVITAKFKEARLLYVFVGAFVVVSISFVMGAIVTRAASNEIEQSTAHMLANAIPSVTAVMNARTSLRRVEIDADELTRVSSDWGRFADEVRQAQQDLNQDVQAEAATPWYPGEREVYDREVVPKLGRLDRAIGDLEKVVGATTRNPAEKQRAIVAAVSHLNVIARDLDASLQTWAEVNHAGAYVGTTHIAAARSRLAQVTVAMQLLSSIAALGAAAIAILAARRFGRVALRNVELETSRANELDVLAQRVAHDLMSPLAAVSLSLASIQRAHPDDDTTRVVHRARRALDRSRQLVNGIYQFAGSGGQPAPGARAPLRATVIDAIDGLVAVEGASPSEIDLQSFEEVEVACDGAALGVVVSNLLSNAAKFTKDCPVRNISVRSVAGERRVRLEVEDSGPGIPLGCEQSIFEPYHRAPGVTQPGLGLGLATVKRIVLAYGGAVGVRRSKAGGAIFWFDLPRAPAVPREEAPTAQERAEAVPGERPGAVHPVH
jgi:signal transduction histidine kinase